MIAPLLLEALQLLGIAEPQVDQIPVGKQQPRALAEAAAHQVGIVRILRPERRARQHRQHHAAPPGIFSRQRVDHAAIDRGGIGMVGVAQHRRPFGHRNGTKPQRQRLHHHEAPTHQILAAIEQHRLLHHARPARAGKGRHLLLADLVEPGDGIVPPARIDRLQGEVRRTRSRPASPLAPVRHQASGRQAASTAVRARFRCPTPIAPLVMTFLTAQHQCAQKARVG